VRRPALLDSDDDDEAAEEEDASSAPPLPEHGAALRADGQAMAEQVRKEFRAARAVPLPILLAYFPAIFTILTHPLFNRQDPALGPSTPLPEHWGPFVEGATAVASSSKEAAAASARRFVGIVRAVNALEAGMVARSDADLAAITPALRARLAAGRATLDGVLPEAFAAVREASRRILGLRHFDVQVMGGAVLHAGCVAEMRTGEGKTLVALLPAYLHALSPSRGAVHVVTVNDYLAVRDAAWVGRVLQFLGVSTAVATVATPHAGLRAILASDVVWATAQTLAFAYLRDNSTAFAPGDVAMVRPLALAIVDEADSILIDECRSPMIISGAPSWAATQAASGAGGGGGGGTGPASRYLAANAAVLPLRGVPVPASADGSEGRAAAQEAAEAEGADFTFDERRFCVTLTSWGAARVVEGLAAAGAWPPIAVPPDEDGSGRSGRARDAAIAALWDGPDLWGPYISNALRVHALYKKDVKYLVRGGDVRIIDSATGRVMPRSRWTDGVHQAVEAKEGLAVQPPSRTAGSITFQAFFRFYGRLAGMTGTAASEAEELGLVYGLDVVRIPPHRPSRRVDRPPSLYFQAAAKEAMLALLVRRAQAGGRPLLIGTRTVEESDAVSALLSGGLADTWDGVAGRYPAAFTGEAATFRSIPHCVLNARPEAVAAEARIVAQAGLPGAVTVSTNMAGRGTDILLGGNARGLALDALARAVGGLLDGTGGGGDGCGGAPPFWDSSASSFSSSSSSLPLPPAASHPPPVGVLGAVARAQAVLRAAGPPPPPPAGTMAPEVSVAAPPGAGVVEATLEGAMAAAEGLRSRLVLEVAAAGLPPLVGDVVAETAEEAFQRAYPVAAALVDQEVWGAAGAGGDDAGPTVASPTRALTGAALITWLWFDCLTSRLGEGVRARGGLLVVCASFLESQRSVDQLLGRCGRQGDPGETWTVLAMEDVPGEAGLARVERADGSTLTTLPASAPGFPAAATWLDAFAASMGCPPEEQATPAAMARGIIRGIQRRVEHHSSDARMQLKAFDGVVAPLRAHTYALRRLAVAGGPVARAATVAALLRDAGADLVAAHCDPAVRPPQVKADGGAWTDTPAWRVGAAVAAARALVDGPAAGLAWGDDSPSSSSSPFWKLALPDPRRQGCRPGLEGTPTLVYGREVAADAPALAAIAAREAALGRVVLFGYGLAAPGLFSGGDGLDPPASADVAARLMAKAAACAPTAAPPDPATHAVAAALAARGGPGARTAAALAVLVGDALVEAYASARRPAITTAYTAHASAWDAQGRALPAFMLDPTYSPASTAAWEKEVLLATLDDAWTDFLVDAAALQGAVSLRSYARLSPLDEFRLETATRFRALLVEWRAAAAGGLFAGPELEVGPPTA